MLTSIRSIVVLILSTLLLMCSHRNVVISFCKEYYWSFTKVALIVLTRILLYINVYYCINNYLYSVFIVCVVDFCYYNTRYIYLFVYSKVCYVLLLQFTSLLLLFALTLYLASQAKIQLIHIQNTNQCVWSGCLKRLLYFYNIREVIFLHYFKVNF